MYYLAGYPYYEDSDMKDESMRKEIIEKAMKCGVLNTKSIDDFYEIAEFLDTDAVYHSLVIAMNSVQIHVLSLEYEYHWLSIFSNLGFDAQIVKTLYTRDNNIPIDIIKFVASLNANFDNHKKLSAFIGTMVNSKYLKVSKKSNTFPTVVKEWCNDRVLDMINTYFDGSIISDDYVYIRYAPSTNMRPVYYLNKLIDTIL